MNEVGRTKTKCPIIKLVSFPGLCRGNWFNCRRGHVFARFQAAAVSAFHELACVAALGGTGAWALEGLGGGGWASPSRAATQAIHEPVLTTVTHCLKCKKIDLVDEMAEKDDDL